MSITLRTAHAGDRQGLCSLLEQLGYPGTESFLAARVQLLLHHADALLLVAEAEGTLLGVISAHFVPQLARAGDFCRISYLCVEQRARGMGVGAALLRRVEEEARRRGCERIELHSHARRTDAHRFYAREGYTESPKYLLKQPGQAGM
jgi:GNAT superfamily N-acetyltransferase